AEQDPGRGRRGEADRGLRREGDRRDAADRGSLRRSALPGDQGQVGRVRSASCQAKPSAEADCRTRGGDVKRMLTLLTVLIVLASTARAQRPPSHLQLVIVVDGLRPDY